MVRAKCTQFLVCHRLTCFTPCAQEGGGQTSKGKGNKTQRSGGEEGKREARRGRDKEGGGGKREAKDGGNRSSGASPDAMAHSEIRLTANPSCTPKLKIEFIECRGPQNMDGSIPERKRSRCRTAECRIAIPPKKSRHQRRGLGPPQHQKNAS